MAQNGLGAPVNVTNNANSPMPMAVVGEQPTSSASYAVQPQTAVNVSSLVLKASAGNFYSASMTAGGTAGYLIVYNAAAAPAAGATLTGSLIMHLVPVAANGIASVSVGSIPDRFSAGGVLLFSTNSTTYTVPANLAQHMRGRMV